MESLTPRMTLTFGCWIIAAYPDIVQKQKPTDLKNLMKALRKIFFCVGLV